MIDILIKSESRYPINRSSIRSVVENTLVEKKMKGKIEISINIVGDRLMRKLNKDYRMIDKTTDVLSFTFSETKGTGIFVDPPDGILRLGDIIVSYPQAVSDAAEEEKMVDDKINELIEHGLLHLLGYHHD